MPIEFHHPTLADRDWMQPYYHAAGYRGCEASFVNMYLWAAATAKSPR